MSIFLLNGMETGCVYVLPCKHQTPRDSRFIQKFRFLFVSVVKLHAEKQTEIQVGI